MKVVGRDYYLPDGKIIPFNTSRPIRSVVADYSLKKAEERPVVKKEDEAGSSALKSSVGRLSCWARPAISSSGRVSFDSVMAKKTVSQPIRRSSRLNKDVEKEASRIEELVEEPDHGEADQTRFSTPEWVGPQEDEGRPYQSTPRSILKKGATLDELMEEELLLVDDDGVSILEPSKVQSERNKILKDVFIEGKSKGKRPSYIIPEDNSRSKNVSSSEDGALGLDLVLQKILDTKITLTIGELTSVSTELARGLAEGKLGTGVGKSMKKTPLKVNAGKLFGGQTFREKMSEDEYGVVRLDPREVYSFLQSQKLGLYSCPLGFIPITFSSSGRTEDGLLDSGSQINIMTEQKAIMLNLRVQVDIQMKLTGISNNEAALIGIVEDVPIEIGSNIWGKCHFWITTGDCPLILGRPFLVDFEARLNFSEKYGESLILVDGRGVGLRFPTCSPSDPEFQRELSGFGMHPGDRGVDGCTVKVSYSSFGRQKEDIVSDDRIEVLKD